MHSFRGGCFAKRATARLSAVGRCEAPRFAAQEKAWTPISRWIAAPLGISASDDDAAELDLQVFQLAIGMQDESGQTK